MHYLKLCNGRWERREAGSEFTFLEVIRRSSDDEISFSFQDLSDSRLGNRDERGTSEILAGY